MSKRSAGELDPQESILKKNKQSSDLIVVEDKTKNSNALTKIEVLENICTLWFIYNKDKEIRTSNLQSPTMLLTGHDGAVYSMHFDPTGQHMASASLDSNICNDINILFVFDD
jgi:hypothetical protein